MEKDRPSKFPGNKRVAKRLRILRSLSVRQKVACGISMGDFSSKEQAIETIQRHLLDDWNGLSASARRALDFVPHNPFSEEEDGLMHLAYMLIDCANRTLDEAVAVRRRRLLDSM